MCFVCVILLTICFVFGVCLWALCFVIVLLDSDRFFVDFVLLLYLYVIVCLVVYLVLVLPFEFGLLC